jgi:hypothetical protein
VIESLHQPLSFKQGRLAHNDQHSFEDSTMKKLLIAAAVALSCASSFAATSVYDGSVAGNQSWTTMLGNDFTANSAVWVTQVGVFDSGMDGLTGSLQVGLYDVTAGFAPVVSAVTFLAGTANGGSQFIYQDVTPVQLTAGHTYSVQAIGFSAADMNFNTNFAPYTNNGPDNNNTTPITFDTFGGALANQESRYGGALGQAGTYFNNSSTFGAGTVAVVPEPETYAMMLAGLGALGFMARRRKQS